MGKYQFFLLKLQQITKLQMDTIKDYLLEDDTVKLRPIEIADIQHLQHIADTEPETWEYSLKTGAGDHLTTYITEAIENRKAEKEYPFIVWDKINNEYAGSTRFYDIQPEHKTLQLGYTWYGKKFRGTGLNKHCKYLLLQFAFETLDYERVELRADARNERSIAAMKSIGCTVEGIMRSNLTLHNGKRRDSIILSILKNEWFAFIKDNLAKNIYE